MKSKKVTVKEIPRSCEECNREFKVKERTGYKFQIKSILIIVGSFIIYAAVLLYLAETETNEEFFSAFIDRSKYIMPFFLGAMCLTYNLPRKLRLRCPRCKNEEIYLITGLPKFSKKPDTQKSRFE